MGLENNGARFLKRIRIAILGLSAHNRENPVFIWKLILVKYFSSVRVPPLTGMEIP